MAVNLGAIWFSVQANVAGLLRGIRTIVTFGQTAQTAANQAGNFQRSLNALSTTAVLVNGPLGGIAARFQAVAASARHGNLGMVAFVGGAAAAVYAMYKITRAAIDATIAYQKLEKAALAAGGSQTDASSMLAFTADIARRTGQEYESLTQQYIFFAAAAKGTRLEGERARDVFEKFSYVAANLNLSAADAEGIFRALQQMMSKGVVQAEELRGQLGDRLPAAVGAAARALGVTTAALDGMLKRGEVTADVLLPALADELVKTFNVDTAKNIDTIVASENRFINSLQGSLRAVDQLTKTSNLYSTALDWMASSLDYGAKANRQAALSWDYYWASAGKKEGMLRFAGAFDDMSLSVIENLDEMTSKLDDWIVKAKAAGKVFSPSFTGTKALGMDQGIDDRWGVAFPPKSGRDGITDSELENWLKSQATAGAQAAEGLREAQVTLSKLNMEADTYANYHGRDLNIKLRELDMLEGVTSKVESFSDALRTAGVAAGIVTQMTEQYRATLMAVAQQKIIDEQTISTFEYFQDVVGNGLTTAVDNFISALGQGKLTMETLKDTARDVVAYMLQQFIKLAIIAPLMNSLFGTASPVLGGAGIGAGFSQAIGGGLSGAIGSIFGSRSSGGGNSVNMNVNMDGAKGNMEIQKTVNDSVRMGIHTAARDSGKGVVATVNQATKRGRIRA